MHWSCPQIMVNSRCPSKPLMCWAADSAAFCLLLPSPSLARPIFFTDCLRKSLRNQAAINHCHPRAVNYHYLWYQPRACNKLWTFIALRCLLTSRLMKVIGLGWISLMLELAEWIRAGELHPSVRQPRADTSLAQQKCQGRETTPFQIR